jgi:hypothetical protein
MKKLALSLVLVALASMGFASSNFGEIKSEEMVMSQIELDALVDLMGSSSDYQGNYAVEIYNEKGELVESGNFIYDGAEYSNTMGYRTNYLIRMKLDNGSSMDFILKH